MDLNTILFGVYPYIAITVLGVGSVLRFDREQGAPCLQESCLD